MNKCEVLLAQSSTRQICLLFLGVQPPRPNSTLLRVPLRSVPSHKPADTVSLRDGPVSRVIVSIDQFGRKVAIEERPFNRGECTLRYSGGADAG